MGDGPALALHRFFVRLAFSAGNIFAWVIVFRLLFVVHRDIGLALVGVSLLYALSQLIVVILTPLTGAALRHGILRALVYGTLIGVFAFITFAALFAPALRLTSEVVFTLVGGFVVLFGIQRALYWIPYAAAGERVGHRRFRFVSEFLIALAPLGAGLAIVIPGGAATLFIIVAGLMLLSLFPLAFVREGMERFAWSYSETFSAFFLRHNRPLFILSFLDGLQGATLLLIWPLLAFLLLNESYILLGMVLSITLLLTGLARRLVRRLLRTVRLEDSPRSLAVLVFSSWILRLAAGTPIQLVLVDTYYHGTTPSRRIGIDAHSFEQSADAGHFVDEYTALKEMGMALGRVGAVLAFIIFLLWGTVLTAFAASIIFAAFAAAASVILSHQRGKPLY